MDYRTGWTRKLLLTAADERTLAQTIEAGRDATERIALGEASEADQQAVEAASRARTRFMEANLGLVISIANRVSIPRAVDRQDVIQDGMLGLERAVEKFDWRKGYKFSTYATWWIRQAIQRGLERTATTIRIPAEPTHELRRALASVTDVDDLGPELSRLHTLSACESIDRPIGDGASTVADLVPSDADTPDIVVDRRLEREQIAELVEDLNPRLRLPVILRFGLDGSPPATYVEIGHRMDLSPEAVRRRVLNGLEQLSAAV